MAFTGGILLKTQEFFLKNLPELDRALHWSSSTSRTLVFRRNELANACGQRFPPCPRRHPAQTLVFIRAKHRVNGPTGDPDFHIAQFDCANAWSSQRNTGAMATIDRFLSVFLPGALARIRDVQNSTVPGVGDPGLRW